MSGTFLQELEKSQKKAQQESVDVMMKIYYRLDNIIQGIRHEGADPEKLIEDLTDLRDEVM